MNTIANKIHKLTVNNRPFIVYAPTSTGTMIIKGISIIANNGIIRCNMMGDTPLDQRNILLYYKSTGKQLKLNCMISDKGELIVEDQKKDILEKYSSDQASRDATEAPPAADGIFTCMEFSKLWLLGLFKPSQMDSPEDVLDALKKIAASYGFNRGAGRTGVDELRAKLRKGPLEEYFQQQVFDSYRTLIDLAAKDSVENQQEGFPKVFEICEKHMPRDEIDKLKELFIQVASDNNSNARPIRLLATFNPIKRNFIMGAFQYHFPLKGKLLEDSNNDYAYSVSSDNFSELIYGLCASIDKENPDEATESFFFFSGMHLMGMKIIKKNSNFKIQLYDSEWSTAQTKNITVSSLSAIRSIKLSYFFSNKQIKDYNIDGMTIFDSHYFTTALLIHVPKSKLLLLENN
jgi:hypothetical protein